MFMDNKNIILENTNYIVLENKNDCLDIEELQNKYTDYFEPYDYILGDYAYGKLRLKGFCDRSNSKVNNINDIRGKELYLKNQCAFNCNYYLIKKKK